MVFKQITIVFFLMLLAVMPITIKAQLDDPTRPPGHRLVLPGGKKSDAAIPFILSSVRISATRRSAVVNDRAVESGDMVNGAKVVAIYPSAVKLKKQGKIFTVRLVSQISKKSRAR